MPNHFCHLPTKVTNLPTYHYLPTITYLPTYLPLLDQHLLTIAYLPTYLPTYLDLATHLLFTYE
jgi:hypothetical protein